FAYSREEGSTAYAMEEPVPRRVSQARRSELMRRQREISAARRRRWVGREVEVLVEQASPDGRSGVGRTEGQAPEIDGVVRLSSGSGQPALVPGQFVRVQVTGSTAYDLQARRLPTADETQRAPARTRDAPAPRPTILTAGTLSAEPVL